MTVTDITAYLGYSARAAVHYHIRNGNFPAPIKIIRPGGIGLWSRADVERWAHEVGREIVDP